MNGGSHNDSKRQRSLHVTHREGLALLAALELAPFEDEVLTKKLLDLVYSKKSPGQRDWPSPRRDLDHQRRRAV